MGVDFPSTAEYHDQVHHVCVCMRLPAVLRDRLQRQASQRAIEAAGSLAAAGAGGPETAEQLPEVFFGRPTVSLPALFQAVSAHAADIRWVWPTGTHCMQLVRQLCQPNTCCVALLHSFVGSSATSSAPCAADAASNTASHLHGQHPVPPEAAGTPGHIFL